MILETIGRKCGKRKNKKMFSNEMKLVKLPTAALVILQAHE